ncbi:glycoside hydrolase family 51 protein [Aulographum hederae CBS 113979]|uniref:non-reducing end alpha-L-arabinofuranosidase n=1 Tax=Aulographum hederae CBS 113979 TaxID=1176131 RepID=A0A6G1HEV1_9PEZI|nr:glycoside hydrolase family 51 protein [Aulographum hederae CBS 113979]
MLTFYAAVLAATTLLLDTACVDARRTDARRTRLRQPPTKSFTERRLANASDVALSISVKDTEARNATAPYLYGLMFEDINHSGDGGLYAELIANRAFQGSTIVPGAVAGLEGNTIISSENPTIPFGPVLTGWAPIGNVRMSLDLLHPLSDALPTVMQVDIPANATGEVGFLNYGWWGMEVMPQQYTASFYALANAPRSNGNTTSFTLSLRSNITGETWASTTVSSKIPFVDYIQLNATIKNTATAPNSNNTFAITMDASQVAGQTFYFDLISLFPETFANRPNGLRKDLAQAFHDMKPRFLRFPGGNNLEGVSVQTRWKWWKTIGPLKDRPGRPADWNYYNTDGLGLLEYLYWTQDMQIEPVLGVYAGFSLDIYGQEGTSVPDDEMPKIVQEALDELEYCMGDVTTKYGALRAEHGHPEPFKIKFVEIGNEDWFSSTYPSRFRIMYDGLMAKYPDITYISTTYNENDGYRIDIPEGAMWDTHHYEEPRFFLEGFNFYDNWQSSTNNTNVGVLLGEFSFFQVDTPSGVVNFSNPEDTHVFYPRLLSAISEGVYALGGERNPNTVKMSSYAPSLQNFNWYNWTPNMIAFTANPKETVVSASYYQQQMFGTWYGTETLPVVNTKGDFNPLFWGASIDGKMNAVYLKVINANATAVPLEVHIDAAWSTVNATILTSPDVDISNSRDELTAIVPKPVVFPEGLRAGNGSFTWDVPGFSITVLQFNTN